MRSGYTILSLTFAAFTSLTALAAARLRASHLVLRFGSVEPQRVDGEPEALPTVAPALVDLLEATLLLH